MSLEFVARNGLVVAVASALLVGGSGPALGQQKESAPGPISAEKVEGVILKVEKVARTGSGSPKAGDAKKGDHVYRISINTNAVWRDWVRDQARVVDAGPARKDAARGEESVATEGQPVDENSLVVIDVEPETRVKTRFRSPSDETTEGEKSPKEVKSDESTASKDAPKAKAVQFRAEDLLPGLFVEAEYPRPEPKKRNEAKAVTVIRPIKVVEPSRK